MPANFSKAILFFKQPTSLTDDRGMLIPFEGEEDIQDLCIRPQSFDFRQGFHEFKDVSHPNIDIIFKPAHFSS